MNANHRIQKLFDSKFSENFLNINYESLTTKEITKILGNENIITLFLNGDFSYEYNDYDYEMSDNDRIQLVTYMSQDKNLKIDNEKYATFKDYDFEIEKYLQVKSIVEYLIPAYSRTSWGYYISEENKNDIERYYRMCFQTNSKNAHHESERFRIAFMPTLDIFDDIVFKQSLLGSINKVSGLSLEIDDIKEKNMDYIKRELQIIHY